MLRLLYACYTWLFWVPMLCLVTLLSGTAVLLLTWFFPRQVNHIVPLFWSRVMFYLTPAVLNIVGRENVRPDQSYVVIANHVSHFDIFVLYGWLPMDLKWVMKKELRKVPVIGVSAVALGHIIIDRQNRAAAVASLQAARTSMRPGSSIMFFPEGTRSRDGKLMEFRKGAFATAQDMDLPILPVTIVGTERILPPDSVRLWPGKVTLYIHPPIGVEEVRALAVDALLRRSRDIVAGPLRPLGMA